MEQFDAASLIEALDALLVEVGPQGIVMFEPAPAWLVRFNGHGPLDTEIVNLFPLLEIFSDGDAAWQDNPGSEVWTQRDLFHTEQVLEVIPLRIRERKLLLLRRPGREFERRRGELQMARDQSLAGEKLATRAREIERVNQLKSEFLASMNHELRTPLNAIAGFSSLLLQGHGSALSSEQFGYATEIHRATDHLMEVINDALEIARIEAGQIVLSRQPVALAEIVHEVVAAVRPLAGHKEITIQTSFGKGWQGEELSAWMDRRRFRQILYNLLSNAIKFTPPGGRVNIEGAAASPETVRIAVTDNGIGIPKAEQSLVFEPFYQGADSALRGGTGLGLAITQRLVKEHGGTITVDSEPERGSVFTVELPSSTIGK